MTEIIVHGSTDEERKAYAFGLRMGMFHAVKLLTDRGKEIGEVAGASPAGKWTDAANYVAARTPKGDIVTTHHLR